MAHIILKIISWLAGKLVTYVLILALLLGIFVVKVVPPMVVKYHEDKLEKAIAELDESKALVGELAKKAKTISDEIESRARELRELDEKRRSMEEWLEKIINVFRKDEVRKQKESIERKQRKISNEMNIFIQERHQLRIEGGDSAEDLKRKELLRDEKQKQLREIHEMRQALDSLMKNELRQMALVALGILVAIIVLPFLWKCAAFYLIAPLAQSSEPILLGTDNPAAEKITSTQSQPAQRILLKRGEVLMTKVDYLQGSMGNFEKRTKWVIDWHYPFSSIAAGLFILTCIRNLSEEDGQVTLSTQDDATEELAVVEIPEGQAMVFRPHFLVAVTHSLGRPPRITSRWVFWKIHAWVSLQFRYLIVKGPAKLVFSAQRGIQAEEVLTSLPGRRLNSNVTVAFSPHLNYSPRRAETFVAYLWGKNALFDDFFQGSGLVIQQQVTGGKKNPAARIWEGVLGAIGKVFGI